MPFSFVADGKPMGYAVDLCLKVAEALRTQLKLPQLRVEWVPVTPATRIPAIVDGRADLECGSTTNNRERRDLVAFTIPALHRRQPHAGEDRFGHPQAGGPARQDRGVHHRHHAAGHAPQDG